MYILLLRYVYFRMVLMLLLVLGSFFISILNQAHQEMSPSAQLQQQQQQQHQSLMSDFTTPSTQKSLLNRQPPVTITKTRVTAKLVINQNRMFIMLMGIRGRKLTKQQLITVYERFKQQLIKKGIQNSSYHFRKYSYQIAYRKAIKER